LEEVLTTENYQQFCSDKIAESKNEEDRDTWTFLRGLFNDSRSDLLNYLGYNAQQIESAIRKVKCTQPL
jgi:hypothetical protein